MTRPPIFIDALALLLALPVGAAHAQQVRTFSSLTGKKPSPPAPEIVFKDIELTAAQEDSLAAIRKELAVRLEKLNAERITDELEHWNRVLDIREWQLAAMRRALTPEQQEIHDVSSQYVREQDAKITRSVLARRDSLVRSQTPP